MSIIIPANSAVSGGFEVTNSAMFSAGSNYLTRSVSNGSRTAWTISAWVKRSQLKSASAATIFNAYIDGNNETNLRFGDDDLEFYDYASASRTGTLLTDRKFRDVASWYHVVAVWDSANGTAGDRMKLYINGVEETSFSTDTQPSSSQNSSLGNGTYNQNVGIYGTTADSLIDGYMAEVCFVDGTVLSPTSFGEFDEDSGIWKPIDVSGLTFGTNGFYLDFKDSSNMGNDANGGTDLTTTGTITQSTDTPMNNFATLNPLDMNPNITLAHGNLEYIATNGWYNVRGSFFVSSGKWYWEMKKTTSTSTYTFIGVATSEPALDFGYGGAQNGLFAYGANDGNKIGQGTSSTSYGASYATGDIMGIALDMDGGTITFYKNGSTQGQAFSGITGDVAPWVTGYDNKNEYNFGSPPYANSSDAADGNGYGAFEYAPPSGYYALCTKNLAEYG